MRGDIMTYMMESEVNDMNRLLDAHQKNPITQSNKKIKGWEIISGKATPIYIK